MFPLIVKGVDTHDDSLYVARMPYVRSARRPHGSALDTVRCRFGRGAVES